MKEMNVSKWAVIAEVVSAVAVVVSLIYVVPKSGRTRWLYKQEGRLLAVFCLSKW